MVGCWRRLELEAYKAQKSSRRRERKAVNTASDRKQKEESKINFLRKFYQKVSKSPGGKTHNKSELSAHPSDIVQGDRLEELSFSPRLNKKLVRGEFYQRYIHLQNGQSLGKPSKKITGNRVWYISCFFLPTFFTALN